MRTVTVSWTRQRPWRLCRRTWPVRYRGRDRRRDPRAGIRLARGGASHSYVARLADELAARVPVDDPIFSFVSSGSEANEVAIKLARDYPRRSGQSGRFKIMSRYGSYHGSTYAATTATAIPAFREPFQPLVPGFVALPQPFAGFCGKCSFDETCVEHCIEDTTAIIERKKARTPSRPSSRSRYRSPAPSRFQSDDDWPRLRELCDRYAILLIADEVVTGFGRTGRLFGCEHWDVKPDIMTMAKGLTSGYIPMGAAAVSRRIQRLSRTRPSFTSTPMPVTLAAWRRRSDAENHRQRESGRECGRVRARAPEPALARQERSSLAARASAIGLLGSLEISCRPRWTQNGSGRKYGMSATKSS